MLVSLSDLKTQRTLGKALFLPLAVGARWRLLWGAEVKGRILKLVSSCFLCLDEIDSIFVSFTAYLTPGSPIHPQDQAEPQGVAATISLDSILQVSSTCATQYVTDLAHGLTKYYCVQGPQGPRWPTPAHLLPVRVHSHPCGGLSLDKVGANDPSVLEDNWSPVTAAPHITCGGPHCHFH